jgi:hypothetical protein
MLSAINSRIARPTRAISTATKEIAAPPIETIGGAVFCHEMHRKPYNAFRDTFEVMILGAPSPHCAGRWSPLRDWGGWIYPPAWQKGAQTLTHENAPGTEPGAPTTMRRLRYRRLPRMRM